MLPVLLWLLYMRMWGLHRHNSEAWVVSKGSSFYFCTEVWWLDLQFHWKGFEFTKTICLLWTTYFNTLQTMHLPLGFPPNPTSLLSFSPFLKKARNKSKKKFLGWNPQKTSKLDRNDTTIFSHQLYILCHFANYTHHKTLHIQIGLFTLTKMNA